MVDYSEEAKAAFHGAENYNCAQAIFKTFQKECAVSEDVILEHKKSGGGRVEGNVCGAVFAVTELIPDKSEHVMAEFQQRAGAVTCRELKIAGQTSCKGCVGIAADILEEELKK